MSIDEELDRVLAALAHPVRRRIIKLLSVKGEASYSDILRELGVESSVLSFHLKKLAGLVEKTGNGYRLTVLGRRATAVLSCIVGGGSQTGLRLAGQVTVYVNDDLLLEAYKAGGLEVDDAGLVLVDHDVSRSLYRRTLRYLQAIAVYVPYDLHGYTQSKAHVHVVVPYRGKTPFDPSYPQEAVRDLEKRGFVVAARALREKLGLLGYSPKP